MTLQDRI